MKTFTEKIITTINNYGGTDCAKLWYNIINERDKTKGEIKMSNYKITENEYSFTVEKWTGSEWNYAADFETRWEAEEYIEERS